MFKMQALGAIFAKLSKKEKFVFYVAVFLVSLIIIERLMVSPVLNKMRSLDKEIQRKEAAIKEDLRMVAGRDRILAENVKYGSFLDALESKEDQAASSLKEIEDYADKASVYLIDMKPSGVKESGTPKKYLITLNCEAQMEQLISFMYNIENSKELLTIERCQLGPKTKGSSVVRCNMVISKTITP